MVDVGCGIGGSSRHIARKFGCTAKGITLSPVQVGLYLTLTGKQSPSPFNPLLHLFGCIAHPCACASRTLPPAPPICRHAVLAQACSKGSLHLPFHQQHSPATCTLQGCLDHGMHEPLQGAMSLKGSAGCFGQQLAQAQ